MKRSRPALWVGWSDAPIVDAEAGGFFGDDGGPPFAQGSVFECGEGDREFVDKALGQAEEPAPAVGGFASGETDFGADAGSAARCGDAAVGLGLSSEGVKSDSGARLEGGGAGLQVFQSADQVDQCRLGAGQARRPQAVHSCDDLGIVQFSGHAGVGVRRRPLIE